MKEKEPLWPLSVNSCLLSGGALYSAGNTADPEVGMEINLCLNFKVAWEKREAFLKGVVLLNWPIAE